MNANDLSKAKFLCTQVNRYFSFLTGLCELGIFPNFVHFQFSRIRSPPYIFPTVSFPFPISEKWDKD